MQVLTVTPHPAIDHTITLDAPLQPGLVHVAGNMQQHAGGKGINVALALALHGVPVAATGLLGQDNDALFQQCFSHYGIADQCIRTPGATRVNTKLVCPAHTTDINAQATAPTEVALQQLHQRIASSRAPWLALCGSLPPGCPADFYQRCLACAPPDARLVVDTSGPALAAVLDAATSPPFAIKPNQHELAQYVGQPLDDLDAVHHAARALQQRTGITWVVVSMGSQGALLLHATQGAVHARVALDAPVHSTVGAGDFMVAGLLAAFVQGADVLDTARMASAFAAFRLTTAAQQWQANAFASALPYWLGRVQCRVLS